MTTPGMAAVVKPQSPSPATAQQAEPSSEDLLELHLSTIQKEFKELGDEVTQLKDESVEQFAQVAAQKKAVEEALNTVSDDRVRLKGEKAKLDMAFDAARMQFSQLEDSSALQVMNLKNQLKKAEDNLAVAVAARSQLEANRAAFDAEMKDVDPRYLQDVAGSFSSLEEQVRTKFAVLEELPSHLVDAARERFPLAFDEPGTG